MTRLRDASLAKSSLISVDVFDTVLLRRPLCETRRAYRAAQSALASPLLHSLDIRVDALLWARAAARRFAYRAVAIEGELRDVRFDDILRRMASLLGLPEGASALLEQCELEQEIAAVTPNRALVARLARLRRSGKRIVALSDTWYSRAQLSRVLHAHDCLPAFDRIYTSADLGATKRRGGAFVAMARQEGVACSELLHLGDDDVADQLSPARHGIRCVHLPRSTLFQVRHRADGVRYAAQLAWSGRTPRRNAPATAGATPVSFGPILAEYALSLWLYLASIEPGGAIALFCARGGLRLALAFQTVIERLGLRSPVPFGTLMVSRLVAARGALLTSSDAAYDELEREFFDADCATVARALAGQPIEGLGSSWNAPFRRDVFRALLADDAHGRSLCEQLAEQHALFVRHLMSAAGTARRILLCDTGLYGSTQRSLEAACPEFAWQSVLLARCNYKNFHDEHFRRATGLLVERDAYSPLDRRSMLLRCWHLIEALFEPALPSVRAFHQDASGAVRADLELPDWQARIHAAEGTHFDAAMRYLEQLRPGDAGRVLADADAAWRDLRQVLLFPRPSDVQALGLRPRSVDFGRDTLLGVTAKRQDFPRNSVLAALWKEGALADHAGPLRHPAQLLLEAAHISRSITRATRPKGRLPEAI